MTRTDGMRFTEEQRLLRDTARNVAQNLLAPDGAERDRESKFPKEALAELGKLGFMGVLVPPEYGGAGADHVGYALALEEIAAGDGSVSTILAVIIQSGACRSLNSARRSRNSASLCQWRRARC